MVFYQYGVKKIYFLGELFINGLLMLVIPLVITSIISSTTSLSDLKLLKGMGIKTIISYMITTGIAVIIRLIFVTIIQPSVIDNDNKRMLLREG